MRLRQSLAGLAIGLGAFLLFIVEPLSTKELLPVMGGSSAVWLSCLCFFQIALLCGYLYATALTLWSDQRLAQRVQLGFVFAAAVCAVYQLRESLTAFQGPGTTPTWTILHLLALRLGLPFLLLSSTSPLLQIWLARWSEGGVPFRLFALSNAGSLAALLVYPTLIEPFLPMHVQKLAWTGAFLVYCCVWTWLMTGTLENKPRGSSSADVRDEVLHPSQGRGRRKGICFLLSAAGTVQLCSITAHLTENVAALPLLWVVPLGVYLLSFVLAFELSKLYRRDLVLRFLVVMLASLGYLLSKTDVSLPLGLGVGVFLTELFFACWFCHAELYQLRPRGTGEAAWFYVLVAAGGAFGTVSSVMLAPLVFRAHYDLPLSFTLTAAMALLITWRDGWSRRLLWSTSAALCLALTLRLHSAFHRSAIFLGRNFYGSLRVKESYLPAQADVSRLLLHGSIQHGMQWFAPRFRREPLTYYGKRSGVGRALDLCCKPGPREIGVIGLGTGTLAAYGRPGDTIRFYEINPEVEHVATELFSYLRESQAEVSVAIGDARVSLEQEGSTRYDVVVIDAFSGDAIPVHLLTLEAVQLYCRHLKAGGVLAFHISNQYLDLLPVLGAAAAHEGMKARLVDSPAAPDLGQFAARWVVMARPDALIFSREDGGPGEPLLRPIFDPWTDDYSSLLPLIRWTGSNQ